MQAIASYTPVKWDEKTYQLISGKQKMTKASVEIAFTGAMEGKALVEWLMYYSAFDDKDPHKAIAQYVGLIHFEGRLNDKTGSFVMEDKGTYKDGEARSVATVILASGTGELKTMVGEAKCLATPQGCSIELNYTL
jgi:hypothetical protein